MITHPFIYCDWLEEQGHNVNLLREDLEFHSQHRINTQVMNPQDDETMVEMRQVDGGVGNGFGDGYGMGEGDGDGFGGGFCYDDE